MYGFLLRIIFRTLGAIFPFAADWFEDILDSERTIMVGLRISLVLGVAFLATMLVVNSFGGDDPAYFTFHDWPRALAAGIGGLGIWLWGKRLNTKPPYEFTSSVSGEKVSHQMKYTCFFIPMHIWGIIIFALIGVGSYFAETVVPSDDGFVGQWQVAARIKEKKNKSVYTGEAKFTEDKRFEEKGLWQFETEKGQTYSYESAQSGTWRLDKSRLILSVVTSDFRPQGENKEGLKRASRRTLTVYNKMKPVKGETSWKIRKMSKTNVRLKNEKKTKIDYRRK